MGWTKVCLLLSKLSPGYISHQTPKKTSKNLTRTCTHATHPCSRMDDLSRLLTNLSTHTLEDFSPHSEAPCIKGPVSKTFSRGAFFVLLSPSACCPHNQINTAVNCSGRYTHPKNGGESCPDQKQTVWSYWIDQSADELTGNWLLSRKEPLWGARKDIKARRCRVWGRL